MPKGKASSPNPSSNRRRPPAKTPEAQESRMISLAMKLVEQRLIDGTATSQETTHFLKLASPKYQLELRRLEKDVELAGAKTELYQSQKKDGELYANALAAFKTYSGRGDPDEDYDD